MILRREMLGIPLLLTGIALAVCLWTLGSLLIGSYGRIEAREARGDFDRAVASIRGRVELVETVARDWAAGKSGRKSLGAGDFEALRDASGADLAFLMDWRGHLVDGGSDPDLAAAAVASGALDPPSPLIRPPASGLLSTGKGLMILASRSLPERGKILVVGRMLDAEELALLRREAGVPLSLVPAEETDPANRPRGMGAFLVEEGSGTLTVSGTLRDLFGHPSLVVTFEKPRETLRAGWIAAGSVSAVLVLLVGALGAVWAVFLRHEVIRPLGEMTLRAERMTRDGPLRFPEGRGGGTEDLSRALNLLLDRREEALSAQAELNDRLVEEIRGLARGGGAMGRPDPPPDFRGGREGGGRT